MNIFQIVSTIFFSALAIGGIVGFFRGWCKSLIRLGITILNFVIALLISPLITGLFTSKVTDGSEISIFNLSFNIADLFKDFIGSDAAISQSTTTLLATSVSSIVVNLLLFLIIFLILQLLSLVIYWIVILVLYLKGSDKDDIEPVAKSDGENNEKEESKVEYNLKNAESIGLKFLGAFEGLVGAVVFMFFLLVPILGVFNIVNQVDASPINQDVQTAQNVSFNNFICGELFYEDSEDVESINNYLNSLDELKNKYNSTFLSKFLKYTGINKISVASFKHLTDVKIAGQKVSLTDEATSLVETINSAKSLFKDKIKFELVDTSIKLKDIYINAKDSIFIQRYLTDILPVWAEKWSNDEPFLSFENPTPEQYKTTVNYLLNVVSSSKSFSRIDLNITAIFDAYKIINEHNFIASISQNEDILELLSNDKTIIKDVLDTISITSEFKNNLPNALNSSLSIVYDIIIGDDRFTPTYSETWSAEIIWSEENQIIQDIVNDLLVLYNKSDEPSSIDFGQLGKVLDDSRTSEILSDSLKTFFICFIESDSIDLDLSIKTNFINLINEKWDYEENPNYSFEQSFSAVSETEKVVNVIVNNINSTTIEDIEDIDLSSLSSSIKHIILDEASKDLILSIATNDAIIEEIIGTSDVASTMTNILVSFIENTSDATIDKDIDAITSVVEIISTNKNINELDTETCDKLIKTIGESETVIKIIDDLTNLDDSDSLKALVLNIGESNLNNLSQSVDNSSLDDSHKTILNKLFDI